MNYHPEFAELINSALIRLDRSPSWLAQRLRVNPSTVSRWLNQGMRPSDPETVVRIADILDLSAQLQVLLTAAGFGYIEPTVPLVEASALASSPIEPGLGSSPVAAPLSGMGFPVYNLPAQTTPLIGRAQELAELAHLLAEPPTR
nr:helix-turn-helix transcriptional regulator [Caldilineaceae bacterium]